MKARYTSFGALVRKGRHKLTSYGLIRAVVKFGRVHGQALSGGGSLIFGSFIFMALFYVMTAHAAGTVFVTNGSTQIGTFPTSLPSNSFRIESGTLNSTSVSSISANFVGPSSTTLTDTTGWTQIQNGSVDDGFKDVTLGFNTTFNTTSYNHAYIGSNTYITFSSGSSLYSGLAVNVPALPGVHMCAADNSYQKVFTKTDTSVTPNTMRVRYEGNNSTSGTVGSPTIVYEAVFYSGQSYLDVFMGSNSRCGGDTTAPTVSSVSSDKANGSYRVGEVIDIDVTFSEAVTSTGNVTVTLETGTTDRTCTFTISSSTTGTCNYTVQAGDTSGDLTVNSVTGTIRDAANNALTNTTPTTNLAANKNIVIDTTNPTVSNVTSSLANGSYKAGQVVPVQVVFAESVTVAGGTPQLVIQTGSPITTTLNYASGSGSTTLVFNYTVDAANYSSDLDHASTTALTLNGATIKDTAGNSATLTLASPGASGSLAANKAIVIDNTAPTVTLTSSASSLTNAAIPVTATFSESVTNFVVGDITVSNGSASSFSGSGSTYTFSVTPSSQGAVSISLAASVAQDAAGNTTGASNTLSRTYDSVAPTVTISTGVASPTLQTPIPFTATFSEAVTDMALSDITVTSGTAGNFVAVSSTVYTFDVSPTGHPVNNVEVYVSVSASKAQDAASNNNSASNGGSPYNIRFDNHSPTLSLTSAASEPTKSSSISVTATFSEAVTGFDVGDLSLSNASASSFSGSGTTYSFTLTPSGQGAVSVQVPASVGQDAATNPNLISNLLSRTYDSVAPTVSLSSSATSPTNDPSISVTATFSEAVTGFDVGDLSLSNASASSFSGSGTTYSFTLTPSGQGAMTVTVPSAVSQDSAGNDNDASSTLSRTYDSQGPTLAEVTPVATTNDFTPNYTFSASENISLTYGGDCSSPTTNATSGNNTITFNTLTDGEHSNCAIVGTDSLGNVGPVLGVSAFTIDSVVPTVALTSAADNSTNSSPFSVTATFSEAVTGFVAGDLSLTNGTASNLSGSDTTYTFDITPSGQGVVSATLPLNTVQDAAGNGNTASDTLSRTYDSVAPTVSLSSSATSPTNASSIPVTATFSEAVAGFIVADISVTNGTAGSFSGSGTTYSFSVTPSGQGAVIVSVPANSAQDAAVNLNEVSNTLSRTYDSVAPTVDVFLADSSLTFGETSLVTITFSEAVTSFSNDDVTTVDNGTLSTLTSGDGGINWTGIFTPAVGVEDSSNIITVTKTGLTDLAGNPGVTKTDSSNYIVETLNPTISSVSSDKANGSYKVGEVIDIDVTFSEVVTSTGSVTVTLETGTTDRTCTFTISNAATGTCSYTVQAGDNSNDLTVNSVTGTIKDAANNALTNTTPTTNLAANKNLVIDTTVPSVSILSTNIGSRSISLVFSSSESGYVIYSGSCGSSVSTFLAGNNTVSFGPLSNGAYTDCVLQLVDAAENVSPTLSISGFLISNPSIPQLTNTVPNAFATAETPALEEKTSQKILLNLFPEFTQNSGKKLELKVNQVVYFQLDKQEHSATITEVTDDYVRFVLASTPQYATLKIGETGRYDVNADGHFDVEVSVLGVGGVYAGMTFKQLTQPLKKVAGVSPTRQQNGWGFIILLASILLIGGVHRRSHNRRRSAHRQTRIQG